MFELNGAVALDGQSFSADNDCGFPGLHCDMLGSRCGNGSVDVGETCDDGAQNDGDCCSSVCQLELPGSRCDTGNPCSESICDGSGACLPVPISGACDDGNSCTTDDTCVDARCEGTALADGASCDDGNACQQGEVCQGGSCMPGPEPTRCGACETCDFFDGCIVAPDYACTYGLSSRVQLRQGLTASSNALSWTWSPDYDLAPDTFGDPRHDTSYELCVFEEHESPEGESSWGVVAQGTVAAGDQWVGNAAGGYRYHAADGAIRSARLRNADPGHVAIGLHGRGRELGLVSLPGDGPVAVQLRGSNAGCWLAEFWGPFQRTAHTWTARID
jgi:cysteine-rich repeat protein